MLKLLLVSILTLSNFINYSSIMDDNILDSGLIIVKNGKPIIDNAQYYSSKIFR